MLQFVAMVVAREKFDRRKCKQCLLNGNWE